ncbi:MAG: minor capsid protein [Candidatus Micrarchaeota archaeon]
MPNPELARIIIAGQRRVFSLADAQVRELRRLYELAWQDVAARLEYLSQFADQRPILLTATRRQLDELDRTIQALRAQTGSVYLGGVDQALALGSATAERIGARLGLTLAPIPHQAALMLHQSVLSLAGDVDFELAQRIKGEVVRGILSGESVAKVRRRIVGTGLDTEGTPFRNATKRAEAIVRTETVRAFNQATVERYRDENEIVGYQWSAHYDACPACLELNGEYWDKGKEERPPLHPNCRCALLLVTKTFGRYDFGEGIEGA